MNTATDTGITIHEIPDYALADFLVRIKKLSNKSEKLLGKPIVPVFHGTLTREITVRGRTHDRDGKRYVQLYHRVSVTGETPKIHGYTFLGTIDHQHAAGNLLRAVPGNTLPIAFRTAEPFCQHCGFKRRRNETFVLRKDADGSYHQIGRQCIRDFIGFDVPQITETAKWLSQMEPSSSDGESDGGYGGGTMRAIVLETYLAHCHAVIKQYGWVSRREADARETQSTASVAMANMFPTPYDRKEGRVLPLTEQDHEVAVDAAEWARALTGKSDYEYNLSVVAKEGVITYKETGLAASMISGLFRHREAEIKRAERRVSLAGSEHQGTVGERLRGVQALVYGHYATTGWNGALHIFRMRDTKGNVFVWFASSEKELSQGKTILFDGTVKKHEEYKNVKETHVNRLKFTYVEG